MKGKFKLTIIFFLFLANFFLWQQVFSYLNNPGLRIFFFDVGQGDAIFLESFQGHQILIDGGRGKSILEKLEKVIPFWDRTLDLVILTHPDRDHLGGLIYVLKRYKIENILWNGAEKNTKTFKKWMDVLKKEKKKEFIAKAGQIIKAGKLKIFILYPFKSLKGKVVKKESNNSSIVSQVLFGKNKFLFVGDISKKIEEKLIQVYYGFNKKPTLRSEVLKIAHHGSNTSSSMNFLKNVSPYLGIIFCGRNNPYHYPHQKVLKRLKEFDIKVLRTDQQGDIKIVSDGKNIKVE